MIEALLQAERLLVHGMVDQAERIYANAIELDPRNAIAVVGLARVALEHGDEQLAYDRACSALGIDPHNAAALRLEARLSEVFAARGEEVARPSFLQAETRPQAKPPEAQPDAPQASPDARPSEQSVFTRNPSMAEHQRMEEQRSRAATDRTASAETAKPPSASASADETIAGEQRPGFFQRLWGRDG